MNKRGQVEVGGLIVLAIAVIVGVILLQASAQQVGTVTNTVAVANTSLATVVNGTDQYLTDYRALSDVVVYNETGDTLVGSGNYTVTNNVVYNGALAVQIDVDASADVKSAWLVSGTAQPLTYEPTSGGRALTSLIIIMMAIAIVAVVITYVLKAKENL